MKMTCRRGTNALIFIASTLAAGSGLGILLWILADVTRKGIGAINWSFFSQLPAPPGMEGGGLANAITGTLLMTLTAALIAVPTGIMAGTYLAEFGDNIFARTTRFLSNILVSAPSIVIGVFVYITVVKAMGHFSGWAGAIALSILMLPVVSRTTEEMLRLVGNEMRESALALGIPHWRVISGILFRAAGPGIATGVMLAVARVAGETAPLLFTALNSPYWMHGMNEPMANLTVVLFNYAMSPYDDWHTLAWGAALLITTSVLVVNIITRLLLRR